MDGSKGFEVGDFFADFGEEEEEMGNGKSTELITGDQEEDGSMMVTDGQSIITGTHGPSDGFTPAVDGHKSHGTMDTSTIGLGNIPGDHSSLANVESMDTSDLIQVPEETANMMMADEDFSDLVPSNHVSNLSVIQQPTQATSSQPMSQVNLGAQTSENVSKIDSTISGTNISTSSVNVSNTSTSSVNVSNVTVGGRTIVMTTSGSTASVVSKVAPTSSGQQPIIIPVSSNILSSPSALSEFIKSIKPPVIGGQSGGQTVVLSQGQPYGLAGHISVASVGKMSTYSKKQPKIAPAPSSSGINVSNLESPMSAGSMKVVQTANGQQLFVQSPVKQEGGGHKIVTIPVSGTTGQVIFLSPMKQTGVTTIKPGGLKTLAPAPVKVSSVSGMVSSVSGMVSNVSGTVSNVSGMVQTTASKNVKQSSVQVVKVVQGNVSSLQKGGTLRPLAPSGGTKTIQLSSAQIASLMSGTASGDILGQKLTLVQASSGGKGTSAGQTIQIGNQQILLPTSSSGPGQVIMLPAQLLQGLSSTSGTHFTIQTGQTGSSIQTGQTGSSIQTGSRGTTVKHPPMTPCASSRSYVPIAPSPVTNSNIHPSTKDVLQKLTPTHPSAKENGKPLSSYNQLISAMDESSRQRKACNCTKSGCLKLYCDCFAQGEFCNQCNCVNCYNNLDHEEERQKAVKQCLERNPHAFHPKIGKGKITGDTLERRHTKGCNCRRSGCLKNYCECYEAKILCSDLCKCCGCKNFEDSFERKTLQLMSLDEAAEYRSSQANVSKLINWGNDGFNTKLPVSMVSISERMINHPVHFITPQIIDSTCACLMAIAAEGEKRKLDDATIEANLLAEFGRCLTKIIDWSEKAINENHPLTVRR